jgi:excisionase family DNA binding protein
MASTVHPDIETSLTTEEAAIYLGLKNMQTLYNWRSLNIGPAYFKIGLRVRYRKADLDAWVQRKITSTYEAEPMTAA